MRNFLRFTASFLSAIIFFIFLTSPSQALYIKSEDSLTLSKDEILNETVVVAGDNLVIDSTINGDLICAGRSVKVNGTVNGDVLCAAQIIEISGNVRGNVRVVAQTVDIDGQVDRNVSVLAQTLSLNDTSSVGGDLFFGVQRVDLDGRLGRDLAGAGENITITGSLLRDALVTAPNIDIGKMASISGNLVYYNDQTGIASIDPKAVKGEVTRRIFEDKDVSTKNIEKSFSESLMGTIFGIVSSVIVGLAIIYFLKVGLVERTRIIKEKPFVSGLIGFAVLFITPLVFIVLLMTVIGIPLAFVLLLEYLLSLVTASVYSSVVLGEWVLKNTWKEKTSNAAWSLIVGSILIGSLMALPVINFFTGLIVLCLGLGAIFLSYLPSSRPKSK